MGALTVPSKWETILVSAIMAMEGWTILRTILIVDDEPRTRLGIQKTIAAWSAGRHRIECAASGEEALAFVNENTTHVLITDIRMPDIDGLQMLQRLVTTSKQMPVVIVISGFAKFEYAKKALQLGVFEYLLKPLDRTVLVETVQKALELDSGRQRLDVMEKLVDPKLLEAGSGEARYSEAIREAVAYINNHMHENISVKHLADKLHMNASYFSVLFKEQTGISFSDYMKRIRMQKAKELLLTTRLPIWVIAEKIGYQTDKYFIRVFKENEGISPGQYRQRVLNVGSSIQ